MVLAKPGLAQLVKQRYGPELRKKTPTSLKTEISQSMSSLLDELTSMEETKVLRTGDRLSAYSRRDSGRKEWKTCPPFKNLRKAAGRSYNSHWLSQCMYLSQEDKKALSRASITYDSDQETHEVQEEEIYITFTWMKINPRSGGLETYNPRFLTSPISLGHYI